MCSPVREAAELLPSHRPERKISTEIHFLSPETVLLGGGLPRKVVRVRNFVQSLEAREIKLCRLDVSEFCWDVPDPRGCSNIVCQTKVVLLFSAPNPGNENYFFMSVSGNTQQGCLCPGGPIVAYLKLQGGNI